MSTQPATTQSASLRQALRDGPAWIWGFILGSSPCLFYLVNHRTGQHHHLSAPTDFAIFPISLLVPAGIVSGIARRYYFFWGGLPVIIANFWWLHLYPPDPRSADDALDPLAWVMMWLVYSMIATGPVSLVRWLVIKQWHRHIGLR